MIHFKAFLWFVAAPFFYISVQNLAQCKTPPEFQNFARQIETLYYSDDTKGLLELADKIENSYSTKTGIPLDWHISYGLGFIYSYLGDKEIARKDTAPDSKKMASNYFERASDWINQAEEAAEKTQSNSNLSEVLAVKGNLIGKKIALISPFEIPFAGIKAQKNIDHSLELDPSNPRALLTEAVARIFKPGTFGGGYQPSTEAFEKALAAAEAFKPKDPLLIYWGRKEEVFSHWAKLEIQFKKWDEAKKRINQSLATNPKYVFPKTVLLPQLPATENGAK